MIILHSLDETVEYFHLGDEWEGSLLQVLFVWSGIQECAMRFQEQTGISLFDNQLLH